MKNSVEQLIAILAISGMSESEIQDAVRAAREIGPSQMGKRVRTFRQRLRMLTSDLQEPEHLNATLPFSHTPVVEEVVRLLLMEASLSAFEAADRLYVSLRSSSREYKSIPAFKPKMGIRTWLDQLTEKIPSSDLLHHATKIRNDVVHMGAQTDWPLKDRER